MGLYIFQVFGLAVESLLNLFLPWAHIQTSDILMLQLPEAVMIADCVSRNAYLNAEYALRAVSFFFWM